MLPMALGPGPSELRLCPSRSVRLPPADGPDDVPGAQDACLDGVIERVPDSEQVRMWSPPGELHDSLLSASLRVA
jgi:hypothetical protein